MRLNDVLNFIENVSVTVTHKATKESIVLTVAEFNKQNNAVMEIAVNSIFITKHDLAKVGTDIGDSEDRVIDGLKDFYSNKFKDYNIKFDDYE